MGLFKSMVVAVALAWAMPGMGIGPSGAVAAELVVLEQPGCAWCARWHAEIGGIYPKTKEAEIAPLRFVDITKAWPQDLDYVRREAFTPTFVLIHEGKEISRMRGYSGDEFFWFLLNEMLAKLPAG